VEVVYGGVDPEIFQKGTNPGGLGTNSPEAVAKWEIVVEFLTFPVENFGFNE